MIKHENYDCRQTGFSAVEALVVLIIIAAFAGGGWYIWQKRSDEPATPNTGQVVDEKQSQKTQDDAYKDWKAFSSSMYGIAFQYPQDWTVTESQIDTPSATAQEAAIIVKRLEEVKYNATVSIEILNKPFDQALAYYDKSFEHAKNKVKRTTDNLKKRKSAQFVVADTESEARLYLFAVGDKTYTIASINEWLNQENDPAYWIKFTKVFDSVQITK